MKTYQLTEKEKAFRDRMIAMMKAESPDIDGTKLLAIVAYVLGQMIAFQDQRKYTPSQLLQLVMTNIEGGNAQAIATLMNVPPAGNG